MWNYHGLIRLWCATADLMSSKILEASTFFHSYRAWLKQAVCQTGFVEETFGQTSSEDNTDWGCQETSSFHVNSKPGRSRDSSGEKEQLSEVFINNKNLTKYKGTGFFRYNTRKKYLLFRYCVQGALGITSSNQSLKFKILKKENCSYDKYLKIFWKKT